MECDDTGSRVKRLQGQKKARVRHTTNHQISSSDLIKGCSHGDGSCDTDNHNHELREPEEEEEGHYPDTTENRVPKQNHVPLIREEGSDHGEDDSTGAGVNSGDDGVEKIRVGVMSFAPEIPKRDHVSRKSYHRAQDQDDAQKYVGRFVLVGVEWGDRS